MTMLQELKKYATPKRKKANEWFFKTGKGEYGYGDKFLGVNNPGVRIVVKKFADVGFDEIQESLDSKFHEERLAAVLILVRKYEKRNREMLFLEPSRSATGAREANFQQKISPRVEKTIFHDLAQICKFYLKNLKRVNNWDLVDLSAHRILGQAILDGIEDEKILDKLAGSKNMWERRVAIISTAAFINSPRSAGEGKFGPTLRIAEKLLGDKEDLTHKAVGWMLREVWKKSPQTCENFLIKNYSKIPRTTLRYAIERMEEGKRKRFLLAQPKL